MIAAISSRLMIGVGLLRQRLSRRQDTEHVQALIRLALGLVIGAYLYLAIGPRFDVHVLFVGFEVLSLAIFLAILVHPQRSVLRRGLGMLLDMGATTYVMLTNGDVGAELTVSLEDEALAHALDALPEVERRVLELRFGLGGREPASLKAVGDELGITTARVKRVEREALEHLSRNRELQELREAA